MCLIRQPLCLLLDKPLITLTNLPLLESQALLGRHESYMAEAEADRARMMAEIETLGKQKEEVQAENARIIQENKDLLEQLEELNDTISESDARIQALSTSLESAQLEIRRLTVAASRAAVLECQLNEMEIGYAQLEQTLEGTQESERSAIHRWRKAELTLRDLHEQIDIIEKESREEREKHVELLGRMERRRAVERELDAAASRLKGAAAATTLGRTKNGTNAVSHFVRDILQDNATLQSNIAELKDLLQSSDEEVRNLRDQLLLHQPLDEEQDGHNLGMPLSEELREVQSPPPVSQEFHVHHHYHTPIASNNSRKSQGQLPAFRRQRRRRAVFPPTLHESPPKESVENPSYDHRFRDSISSISTPFFQTSPSTARTHRWLDQTPGPAFSSAPSSPKSAYRAMSIFDRSDLGFESSRPTSPESAFASPLLKSSHRKGPSDVSICSALDERGLNDMSAMSGAFQRPQRSRSRSWNKMEPSSDGESPVWNNNNLSFPGLPVLEEQDDSRPVSLCRQMSDDQVVMPLRSPQLRRTTSHESLLSISGMDIHSTSDYFTRSSNSRTTSNFRKPLCITEAGTIFSSTMPVISRTNVTVSKASRSGDKSPLSLLSTVVSATNNAGSTTSPVKKGIAESNSSQVVQPITIKKRMGGWGLGKWNSSLPKSTAHGFAK